MNTVLGIQGLSVEFRTGRGVVRAVEDLTFNIAAGETVALVGESGSGKSTAALAILGLIADPPGRLAAGRIEFEGADLVRFSAEAIRTIRGQAIAMIFQDPLVALNPIRTIGRQLREVLQIHEGLGGREATGRVLEALGRVGMPAPERQMACYPHTLSGGMLQRAMIAMALLCRPRLLIADEPTTALDVTVQAQVLRLLNAMQQEFGMAVLLITHDFGVVAETARRVVVMYAGRKVEEGPVREIFDRPQHPYTAGLLKATRWSVEERGYLPEIPGAVPSPFATPPGCNFAPRCPHVMPRCREQQPALRRTDPGHEAACLLIEERAWEEGSW